MNSVSIKLRAVEPDDVDSLFIWENDEAMWRYGCNKACISRSQLWNYVQNYDADPLKSGEIRFIIEESNNGETVGCIDLTDIDPYNGRAQVGIYISKRNRCKGFGEESLKKILEYAAETLGLHQVWAVVGRENTASISLFEKCEFKSCGCLRSWIRKRTSYEDALVFQHLI